MKGTRMAAQASACPSASGSSSAMAGASGSSRMGTDQPFSLPSLGPDDTASAPVLMLMVEDNLADALIVREAIILERLPVELRLAKDGEAAWSFIENAESDPQAPCPQALLLDLNLPKMDGFQILKRLR